MAAILGGAALALSGCASMDDGELAETDRPAAARATLYSASGVAMGDAMIEHDGDGLRLTVNGMMMPQGPHGAHVHTAGRCDAPGFESAGPHWNPAGRMHGRDNPQGAHAGDLPNLLIGTDGRGSLGIDMPGARLDGAGGLLDADGAAIVIHAAPDDFRTDPSGNSGARIACGVFARS